MAIFLDTANIAEIKKYKEWGIISGVTTNQKVFLKEKGVHFGTRIREILDLISGPVNVELTKTRLRMSDVTLITEAIEYKQIEKRYRTKGEIVIKVPMWKNGFGLVVAEKIMHEDIPVNLTCCMSVNQAILACELGVEYVSLFYNRILDYVKSKGIVKPKYQANQAFLEITRTRNFIEQQNYKTKIIAGSIRKSEDVSDAFGAGAHIVTITPEVLEKLPYHPKTEETIKEFDKCWEEFTK